jgi:hypothetical protein
MSIYLMQESENQEMEEFARSDCSWPAMTAVSSTRGVYMGFWDSLWARRRESGDQWQTPIVQEICIAMLQLVPKEWKSAYLVLDVSDDGLGNGLVHSAITPQLSEDGAVHDAAFVLPDMAVMAATRNLELGLMERRKTFKRVIISAVADGEDWQVRSDYDPKRP